MELSVIENDHAEVKKYLKNFVPDNYYKVLGDAYLYQVRAVLQHAVRNPGEYNARYDALINSLTSQFEDSRVNIGQQISAWADKQSVHAQRLTYLEAENSTVSAGITELEKIIISNNKAVLEKTNKLAAQLKDFEVGGVNLIQNSTFAKGYRAVGDVAITTSDHVLGTLFKIVNLADSEEEIGIGSLVEFNKIKLMEGKQYTLSFYGFGSVELLNNVKLYKGDLVHTLDPIIMDSDISNRKIITFIAPFSGDDIGFSIGTVGYPIDSWFSLVAVQLELGSRATDWSPSPFDNADYIARVAASIEEVRKITIEQQEVNVAAIDTLRANIGETKGQISNEREINLTKFTSMTRQLDELTSSTAGNTSRITNLDKTYTDKFTSNAEKLVELEANVGASNAAITKVDKVVATNTSAIATSTNNLSAKIDGIKIGGRNLIRNSTFKLGHEAWGDATITRKDTVLGSEVTITNNGSAQFGIQNDVLFRSISLVEGEEYTLSFYGNGNIPSINSIWLKSVGKDPQLLSEIAIDEVLAEKKVLTFTSTITADDISIIIAAVGYPKESWFKIVALQLEKGNKATDWTEAPEDIVNFISGVEANIDEFKSVQVGINGATATQIDTLNTKTSKSSAAIDELRTASSTNENAVVKLATDLRAEFKAADTKVEGVIASEKKILLDANTALAETVSKLDTRVGSNSSTISSNYKTLNDKHSSLAEVVTTIGAKTDSALSKISVAQIAIASNTGAITKNKTDITAAYTDAIAVVDGKINTRLNSLDTLVSSKADVKRVDTVENTAKQSLAETKVELLGSFTTAVNTAKDESAIDAQDKADKALANATVKANQAQTAAERYALAQAELEAAKALDDAKSDATTKANLARANAEMTAAQDAKNKADEALKLAKEDAAAKVKVVQDMLDALAVVVDSKASITRVDKVVNDATQALAEAKTEITGSYTTAIKTAKTASATDAQDKANEAKSAAIAEAKRLSDLAESAAKSYASTEQNLAEERAKAYADGVVTAEELARLAQAKDNLDTAMLDSQKKANAAKQAAIEAAAADATVKANQSLSDSQALILKAVEGIEIGGRNLVRHMPSEMDFWLDKKVDTEGDIVILNANTGFSESKPIPVSLLQSYTISFDVIAKEVSENSNIVLIDFFDDNNKRKGYKYLYFDIDASNWTRVSHTFEVPNIDGVVAVSLGMRFNSKINSEFQVKNLKVEKGNKATEWTPAPEDLQLNAEKLATEAKEAAQTFATTKAEAERVKAEAYADGKVTEEELARIAEVDAKHKAALLDATQKSEAAKNAAILAAATDAKTKADNALASAKTEANRLSNLALDAAKVHANNKAEAERLLAEAHADGIVTIEEEERIKQANAIAEAAKLDATKKADAAKSAAVIAAAADADSKVSQAILNSKAEAVKLSNEALAAAKVYANAQAAAERLIAEAHADNIVTVEEQARIAQALQVVKDAKADATKKADAAQDAAIKAAALDATAKANKALADAKEDSANKVAALKIIVDSKASVTSVEKVVNDANQALATVEGRVTSAYSKAIEDIEVGGRNLIIQKNIIKGRFVNHTNGALGSGANHDSTDIIPVESGKTYSLSASNYLDYTRVVFYDADKTFISGTLDVSSGTVKHIIPPPGTAFLRISSAINSGTTSDTWKLEKGNKVTDWTPAPEDVTDYIDSEVSKLNTTIDSKADIDTVNKVVSDANHSLAELKTSITGEYTKAIGTSQTASFLEAKSKADKALADAKSDATKKVDAAKDAAAEFTRLEAKAKADAALALASDDATDKANAAKSAAELAAANDAKAKADKALSDAKADATAKANAAEKAAKEYADSKAKGLTTLISSKADIDTVNKIKNDTDGAIAKQKTDITADYSKAISDIEVGGRNLIIETQSEKDVYLSTNGSIVDCPTDEFSATCDYYIDVSEMSSLTISTHLETKALNGGYFRLGWYDATNTFVKRTLLSITTNMSVVVQPPAGCTYLRVGYTYDAKCKIEKGNKSTDWTPAPEDVQASLDATTKLIEKESSARATAIADTLKDAKAYSNQLDDVIKGSFKDGLIDEAEAISIKAHINELNTQKSDLDQKYTSMYANTDLVGTPKTDLHSAKVALNSKYTDLVNYINSVTSNGKVTKAQSEAVSTKFTAYADALKLLSQKFEEANDSIVTKAKSDAVSSAKSYTDGVVNPLKKEVDSKASITRVEQAEGYADRAIGESSKTITASYKKAIDDVEIGGRNLLTGKPTDESFWFNIEGVQVEDDGVMRLLQGMRYPAINSVTVMPGETYVVSYTAKTDVPGSFAVVLLDYLTSSNDRVTYDYPKIDVTSEWKRHHHIVTVPSNDRITGLAVSPRFNSTEGTYVLLKDIKVEKGNKATDWTPAPEDITSAIEGTIESIKRVEATANGVKAEASSIITVGNKITGWKNLNDGTTSSFDILDDNFSVGNSTTSKKPFKIVGSDIQFNGKVSFNSVVGDVPGSRITNGTLDLNKLNSTDKSLINTASSNASSALSKAGTAQNRADSAWDKAGTAETNAKTHTDNVLKNTIYYPNSTTIDGTKIETGTIVANKLSVNSLSALSANMGAITSGSLNINNKFIVDSSGNMTATSGKFSGDISGATGKFSGTVLANKIEGKVGNIADFAVDTLQIAGNAVTVTGVFFAQPETHFNIAQTDYTVAELDIDSAGGTVIVDYAYTSMRVYRYGAPPKLMLKILRNDELLKEREYYLTSGGTTTFPQYMFLPIVDNPPKGINKYTVVLYIKDTKESDIRVSITDRCLIVRGAKDDRK